MKNEEVGSLFHSSFFIYHSSFQAVMYLITINASSVSYRISLINVAY